MELTEFVQYNHYEQKEENGRFVWIFGFEIVEPEKEINSNFNGDLI